MKAVVVHQYGGPEVLKFEEYPDPVPGPGEVLVRVAATSMNPIDYQRRADRQGQAGRSLCIGCRGTAERRGVPICKGGASILEI